MKPPSPLIELLYQALASRYGIVVTTSNPVATRQKFYALRRQHEPIFDQISVLTSPFNNREELILLNKPEKEILDGAEGRTEETHPEPPAG